MSIPAFIDLPMQINFHNMAHSAALESNIHERATRLERFSDMIKRIRVTVDAPNKHHHQGVLYHVTIDITVPGAEIVASHGSQLHHAHEDVYLAIRDAMNSAERQLEEYDIKRRGEITTHPLASTLPGRLLD